MKTILVTGGVRGIGRSIAALFFKRGYRVCVTYSRDEASAKLAREAGFEVYRADVSKEDDVTALFQQIGQVDVLVNNAGVALIKQIQDIAYEEFQKLWLSTSAVHFCARVKQRKG